MMSDGFWWGRPIPNTNMNIQRSQTRQLLKYTGACPGVRRVTHVIFSNIIIYSGYLVYVC